MAALGSGSPGGVLRGFSPRDRRWLLINAVIVPAVINAGSSAGIAWLSLGGERTVPVWSRPLIDKPGLVTDTLGTFLILPFLTTIGINFAVRFARRNGQLEDFAPPAAWMALVGRLPDQLLRRAGLMAAMVLVLLGPLALVVLSSVDFHASIDPSTFVVYKTVLGVALGAVFTPLIAIVTMATSPEAGRLQSV